MPPPILTSVLESCWWWFVTGKRYPVMDRGMLVSLLMKVWVVRLRLRRKRKS